MTFMQKYYSRLRGTRWLLFTALLAGSPAWADGPVTVSGAWVRGTAGPQTSTGAFMSIRSSKDIDLIAVESPAAKSVSLHETIMAEGVARMRPVAKLKIPAGQTVELKPGAYHVMLEGLKKPLAKGASVPIILIFEDSDKKRFRIKTKAQVRALGEGNPSAQEMMPGMNMK
jgi:hypothetical protein